MYAVVSSGGKQYRVEAGSLLTLERLDGQPGEPGASVTFDRVLLISDGDEVTVGTPVVAGASVSATVIGEALGPKLVIFKFKQKVKYRRRNGHRQHLTQVRIDGIHPTAASRHAVAPKAELEARVEPKGKAEPRPKAAPRKSAVKAAAAEPETARIEVKAAPARTARPRAAKAEAAKAEAAKAEAATEKAKARRAPRPKAKE